MKKLIEELPKKGDDIILFYDGVDTDNCKVGLFDSVSKDKQRISLNLGDEDDEEIEYYDVDINKATWQTWSDYIFPKLKKYKYIVAWSNMMGSFQPYIDSQVLKAERENAPVNSIYQGRDSDKEWITIDVLPQHRVLELESLIPSYLK